jgi:hypothetical protein
MSPTTMQVIYMNNERHLDGGLWNKEILTLCFLRWKTALAKKKKNQVAAGESNLSFALQKIPTQTVVSGEEYTSSLSTNAPGQCVLTQVNSIQNTQLLFTLQFKATKLQSLAFWFCITSLYVQVT